jgi:hypothetical protein
VAKLVKVTPPNAQRMVGRLQLICERERLKADRQALTNLHEMHSGDIRSCLNALDMLSVEGGQIDVHRIKQQGSSVRDMQSAGLFDVWTQVFRVAGAGGGAKRVADNADVALANLRHELKSHFSTMGQLLAGCHHNYASVKYVDPRMRKTSNCLEVLALNPNPEPRTPHPPPPTPPPPRPHPPPPPPPPKPPYNAHARTHARTHACACA